MKTSPPLPPHMDQPRPPLPPASGWHTLALLWAGWCGGGGLALLVWAVAYPGLDATARVASFIRSPPLTRAASPWFIPACAISATRTGKLNENSILRSLGEAELRPRAHFL